MAEVAMVNGIFRRKIFSIFRDLNDFGIRWARIFDKRIVYIVEDELKTLRKEFPDFEFEIKEYPQNFSDQY